MLITTQVMSASFYTILGSPFRGPDGFWRGLMRKNKTGGTAKPIRIQKKSPKRKLRLPLHR